MSTGTNQERIQQNNLILDTLKTHADNLPEYQDIQKIYQTTGYKLYTTNQNKVQVYHLYKNYYSLSAYLSDSSGSYYRAWSYKINDDASITALSVFTNYSNRGSVYIPFDEDDTYIYLIVGTYGGEDIVWNSAYIYKMNKETNALTQTQMILGKGGSGWNYVNTTTFKSYNGKLFHIDTSGNGINMYTLSNDKTSVTTKWISGSGTPKLLSDDIVCFKGTNYIIKSMSNTSKSNTLSNGQKVNFVNSQSTKIMINNNLYYLNDNLTIGELIKENCIVDLNTNMIMIPISNNIYMLASSSAGGSGTGYLYEYDDENNTFTLLQTLNKVYQDFSTAWFQDSSNIINYYTGDITTTLVGYQFNGDKFYLHKNFGDMDNRLTANVSLYDYYGNVITGTMPNNGELNYTPSSSQQTIPAGYTSGGTIEAVDYSDLGTITPAEYDEALDTTEDILTGEILPYKKLSYIESSGTQYINTSIIPTNNTKVEFDFACINYNDYTDSWEPLFGSRTSASASDKFVLWLGSTETSPTKPDYKSLGQMHGSLPSTFTVFSTSSFSTNRTLFVKDKNNVLLGETQVNTLTQSTFTGTYNMYLFTQNTANNADNRKVVGKLYGCKIYENGTLVRDYIPVKRKSDDAICLYDKVSETFFTNQGTGTFIAGPEAS